MDPTTTFHRFETADAAAQAIITLLAGAGRDVAIHSRNLEESIWERPDMIEALREFLTARAQRQLRVLVGEPTALTSGNTRFMALAQRLSSLALLRQPDPDQEIPDHECVVSDRDAVVVWDVNATARGEWARSAAGRAQSLRHAFDRTWERARPCTEFRALGI